MSRKWHFGPRKLAVTRITLALCLWKTGIAQMTASPLLTRAQAASSPQDGKASTLPEAPRASPQSAVQLRALEATASPNSSFPGFLG